MTLTKVTFSTSGIVYAAGHNDVQTNYENWVRDLDYQVTGSFAFDYFNGSVISGISCPSAIQNAAGWTFHWNNGSQLGSVVEVRDGKTVVNGFAYSGGEVALITKTVS
jgi:hypothetical protein